LVERFISVGLIRVDTVQARFHSVSEIQRDSAEMKNVHEMVLILRTFDRSDDVVVGSMDLVVIVDIEEVRLQAH